MILLVANLLGFKTVWIATAVGAARGLPVAGLVAFALFAAWQLTAAPRPRRELLLLALVAPAGWLIDSGYVALDLLRFTDAWPAPPLAPWWIALLWANFALVVNFALAPLRARPWIAAGLGAFGGPFAYLAAEQLGAVSFTGNRAAALALLAGVWAAAMPLLFLVNRRLTRFLQGQRQAS